MIMGSECGVKNKNKKAWWTHNNTMAITSSRNTHREICKRKSFVRNVEIGPSFPSPSSLKYWKCKISKYTAAIQTMH